MLRPMTITIPYDQLQQNILALTAVIARNKKDMSLAITADNMPAVGAFIGESVTDAENELHSHLKDSHLFTLYRSREDVVINLKDKKRMAVSTPGQITSSIELYVTHYVISRWYASIESAATLVEAYQNSAAGYLATLIALICQRDPYVRSDDSYTVKAGDAAQIGGERNPYAQRTTEVRQRDLQPIEREDPWPDGAMLTTDDLIPTDCEDNILVSQKDEEYEDNH